MAKNFDDFFLSNLADLRSEALHHNTKEASSQLQKGSPKKSMTLAEYKEQMKLQKTSPISSNPIEKEINKPQESNPQQPQMYPPTQLPFQTSQNFGYSNFQQPNNFYYQNPLMNPNPQYTLPSYNMNPMSSQMNYQYSNYYNPQINYKSNTPSIQKTIGYSGLSLNLSSLEENHYQRLYLSLPNRQISGEIPAKNVVDLMKTSNLSLETLKEFIRKLKKPDNGPNMMINQQELYLILKMIALTQNNFEPNQQNLMNTQFENLPIFHNLEEEKAFDTFQSARGGIKINNENHKIENDNIKEDEDEFGDFESGLHKEKEERKDLLDLQEPEGKNDPNYDKYNVFDGLNMNDVTNNTNSNIKPENDINSTINVVNNVQQLNYFQNISSFGQVIQNNNLQTFPPEKNKTPEVPDLYNPFSPNFQKQQLEKKKIVDQFSLEQEDDFQDFQQGNLVSNRSHGGKNLINDDFDDFQQGMQDLNPTLTNNEGNKNMMENTQSKEKNENFLFFNDDDHVTEEKRILEKQKERELKKKVALEGDTLYRQSPLSKEQKKVDIFEIDWPEPNENNSNTNNKEQNLNPQNDLFNTQQNNSNFPSKPENNEIEPSNTRDKYPDLFDPSDDLFNQEVDVPVNSINQNISNFQENFLIQQDFSTQARENDMIKQQDINNLEVKNTEINEKPVLLTTKKTEDLMDFDFEEENPQIIEQNNNNNTNFKALLEGGLFEQKIFTPTPAISGSFQFNFNDVVVVQKPPNNDNDNIEDEEEFEWNEAKVEEKPTEVSPKKSSPSKKSSVKEELEDQEFEWSEANIPPPNNSNLNNFNEKSETIKENSVNLLDLLCYAESFLPQQEAAYFGEEDEIDLPLLAKVLSSLELFEESEVIQENLSVINQINALENRKKELVSQEKYEEVINIRDQIKELEKKRLTNEKIKYFFDIYKNCKGKGFSSQCLEKLAELKNAEHFINLFIKILKNSEGVISPSDLKQLKAKKNAFVLYNFIKVKIKFLKA